LSKLVKNPKVKLHACM